MKKLVLMFVAIAAISFASCGNKTEKAAGTDSLTNDTVQVDTTSADTTATDSVK
ncbi:MAG: PG1828 family lipoprotein [Prevotella sp.]